MYRTSFGLAISFAVGAVLLLPPPPTSGQRSSRLERQTVNGRDVVAREVLVKFRQGVQPADLAEIAAEIDAQDVKRIGRAGALRLRSKSLSAAALLERLARRDDVVYAEPNFIIHIGAAPNDLRFPELWGLDNIHATPAWDLSVGSSSNVVAVIDTGIDYTHEDLAANIWSAPTSFTVNVDGQSITCAAGTHGFNAITGSCNPRDDQGHGTHVSGTIGAVGNNGIGVVGVNWTTQLVGIKFLDALGSGTTADAIAAVEFAIAVKQAFAATGGANIRVLSNSWGGPGFSQALLDQVNAANDADMLFVAGAGNDGFDNDILPFYPASFGAPNVISVAATGYFDDLSWFSNYGAASVHLGAPGEDILSTTIGDTYDYASGTSMATPHVSGAAALVLSYCALSTAALKDTLLGSVDSLPALAGITVSGGRLNVNNALHACTAPPETPAGLDARGADTKVTLSWSGALGAMRYNVKRSLTAGGPYPPLASAVKGTGYTDTAVVNGTIYYYVVSAENTLGESGNSNEASATPNIPPDMVVSSLTSPAVAAADSTIVVSVTTKNQGAGRAQPSTTRFYLSDDSSLSASDVRLGGEQAVPELAAGAVSSASVTLAIPADATVGRHYLIVNADDDDVLDESIETNNRLARQLLIGPDLLITSFTAPATGGAGGTISVTDTVKNQGGGDAAVSRTTFYLSANSTIGAGDVLLAESRDVPALAAGASSIGTTVLTIPPTTQVGSYYIVAKADGNDAVPETTEANNTSARAILIGSDLMVSALTVPGNGAADSTIVVTDTIKNQGGGPAAASVTRFYLSANSVLDSGDTLLAGSRDVTPLDPGTSSSGSTTVVIPAATAPGTYYIVAKADADGAVPETTETNNTYARTIQIGSDLIVSAVTVPATAGAGATIVVGDTTANQGADRAAASVTRFYLSANSTLDGGDVLLSGAHVVPDLAAGATDVGSTTLTIPSDTATGLHYIIAKADADNVVLETKETNNTAARAIQIGSDLIVSALAVPADGGAGLPIVVTDTVKNQGGGPAAASVTRFYLSANALLDAGDVLLAGSRDVAPLDPATSSTGSTTVAIPAATAAGAYYIVAKADADGAVPETSETNNTYARSIKIGSDLVVSALTVPAAGAAGGAISVTDTVKNQGGGDAAGSSTTFYLSANSSIGAGDVLLAASRDVPGLAAGATSVGATVLTIPPTTQVGSYYIVAKADGNDVVAEMTETNNTSTRAILIGGDLIVSALTVPANGGAGLPIVVTDTIKNQGGGAAAASVTRFYLSANSVLDGADTLLAGGRDVAALDPGITSTGSTTVIIPPATSPGAYYIVAKADGDNAVAETTETNNTYARYIVIGSDLVVSAMTVPAKAGAGATITVSHTTANQGGGPATATVTLFYLSANAVLDGSDVLLAGAGPVPDLAAGATDAGSTSLTISSATASGAYYIIAKADAENVVLETNETNNTLARSVQIGSDLVISTISTPATKAAAGSSIVVSETVTNQGGGDATASVTRFYLSADGLLDAGDVLMEGARAVPELPAGASSAGSTSVIIPAGSAAGTFYIIAKADADGTVGETLETNNTKSRSISIGPDLTIASLSVSSASVPAGALVNVTDTVTNQGAETAASSTTRFYLSKNTTLDASDVALAPGRSVPEVAGGASSAGATPVTIPLDAAPGSYYVLAKADGDGVVGESLETNNVTARAIQVILGP